jgi:hypothetical protein
MQAYSRLAAVLVECQLHDAAVPVLEELISRLPANDGTRGDTIRRLAEARSVMQRKLPVDHYKVLGVARNCQADQVPPSTIFSSHGRLQATTRAFGIQKRHTDFDHRRAELSKLPGLLKFIIVW